MTGCCLVIFFADAFPAPAPALGDDELPGRDVLVGLEAMGLGKGEGAEGGPVDRMKSAKSRIESSLPVGSRANAPGERGPGDFGTDLGGDFSLSIDDVAICDGTVGLVPFGGFDRKPFKPLSFDSERDVTGRSFSALAGAEF